VLDLNSTIICYPTMEKYYIWIWTSIQKLKLVALFYYH